MIASSFWVDSKPKSSLKSVVVIKSRVESGWIISSGQKSQMDTIGVVVLQAVILEVSNAKKR